MYGIKARSGGFTLLELVFVLVLASVITALFLGPIMDQIEEAKADASIGKAKAIVRVCEIARRKVINTTFTGGIATHTYNQLNSWAPVSSLQALLSVDYRMPNNNAFDLPYYVRFDAARCYVAVDLPFVAPGFRGYETTEVGTHTRFEITNPHRNISSSHWVSTQKKLLHLESTR